ncbi:choline/ethanolamine kinase [Nitzschia inconspicua]|uniref:ethanolamine kinase n=1 Tax=Nitzschia inconspicua TaxID=303405 RepID=A0A9K3KCX1_9STRA|nr:choline/ethanolamine kinase [Nitzschia inconspicua]
MSPNKFRKAREQYCGGNGTVNKGDHSTISRRYYHVTVEDKPYYPFLEAHDNNVESIKEVTACVLGLSQCAKESLFVSPVLGGNTNTLFCVSSIQSFNGNSIDIPESVLVRIFGAPGLIDRDVETSTYAALAQQGLALAYFGRFANGRIEEWSDWKPITESDMAKPDISCYIAMQLARLHCCFNIPPHLLEYHNPQATPTMWTQLEEWLASVQTATFRNDHDTQRAQDLQLHKLNDEVLWLKESVIPTTAKIGFCHNDLLASNILCSVPLQLIDFEYGGINYLAYDIANHFNEFAGGTAKEDKSTPDYSRMPSPKMQRHFCRAYLNECLSYENETTQLSSRELKTHLDKLVEEVEGFMLANHLVWGLWGIHQASQIDDCTTENDDIDKEDDDSFDYLHYGSCRIKRYWQLKEEWLQKMMSSQNDDNNSSND